MVGVHEKYNSVYFSYLVVFSDALSSDLIEFIVDSGSEVSVTVKEELITELKLEYVKNVESRGVHASADKPTYKGVLKLGNEELEVEVRQKNILSFAFVSRK